jgi:hypothetical protein
MRKWTHYLLLFSLCALLTQCGTGFQILPLIGDDPEIVQMIGASGGVTPTPDTVDAVERFYRAARSFDEGSMWKLLSQDTRQALNQLARKLDSNGKALLKHARFPALVDGKTKPLEVSLVALFLVRHPTSFRAVDTPGPAATSSTVLVSNSRGQHKQLVLRRERGLWCIHHPDFSMLPPAEDLRPKLLPQDQPKKAPAKALEPPPEVPKEILPKKEKTTLDF